MIYNEYELIYVARPELASADLEKLSEKVSGVISKTKGEIFVSEDWGKKRLAYPIDNHEHGHYVYVNFVGPAELPLEVERNLRIDDGAIRYITVRLSENIDPADRKVLAEQRQEVRQARQAQEMEAEQARAEAEQAREQARQAARARDAEHAARRSAADADGGAAYVETAQTPAEEAPAEEAAEAAAEEVAEAPAEEAAEAPAEEAAAETDADADKADG